MVQKVLVIILLSGITGWILVAGAEFHNIVKDRELASYLHFVYFTIAVIAIFGLAIQEIIK